METQTNPIRTLREQATRLEAAISVSLADPTRKAVHELRSETRRIEAQIDLLQGMRGLPRYRPAAKKLLRRLRKLRRLAGEVRDCDVQRKLLKSRPDASPNESPDALNTQTEAPDELQKDRDKLRKILGRRRRRAESKLLHTLERQRTKLARDLEAVLETLKPQESAAVSAEDLLKPIERRLGRSSGFHQASEKRLHNLRKEAKHARYQCEALPGAQAASLAQQLEDLQDAGGSWHDLLILAEHGAKKLGADHPLARVLERSRDEHLNHYLEKLKGFRRAHRDAASSQARTASARKAPGRASVRRKGAQAAKSSAGARHVSRAPRPAHKMAA